MMLASSDPCPRDKVLAQFVGVGTLTIDRRILASVLLELGGAVWSAAHVNALLGAFHRSGSGPIQCEEFVDWVFSESDCDPTPEAAEPSCPVLANYMEALVRSIGEFRGAVDIEALVQGAADGSPEELQSLKQHLLERLATYVREAQCRGLAAVWDAFDGDGDGILTQEESEALVTQYLRHSAEASGEVVRASTMLSAKLQVALAIAGSPPGSASLAEGGAPLEAQAQSMAAGLEARLAPRVRLVLEEALARDPRAPAAELLEAMGPLVAPGLSGTAGRPPSKEALEHALAEALRRALGALGSEALSSQEAGRS